MHLLWLKAVHLIFVITWFAGLFYLPRLFVYHADCKVKATQDTFCIMEHKLYYYITWPSAVLVLLSGAGLISQNPSWYLHAHWMQIKLSIVALLWVFHVSMGYFLKRFRANINEKSHVFFRWYNEFPSLCLIIIVLLAVFEPFSG